MKKSAKQPDPLTRQNDTPSRATPDGTKRFAARFSERFVGSFYRPSAMGVSISSVGLGTYLGESTDADDDAYIATVRHAIASGINLIDTAINYRCQRSERALCAAIQQAVQAGDAARDELVICSKAGYI